MWGPGAMGGSLGWGGLSRISGIEIVGRLMRRGTKSPDINDADLSPALDPSTHSPLRERGYPVVTPPARTLGSGVLPAIALPSSPRVCCSREVLPALLEGERKAR